MLRRFIGAMRAPTSPSLDGIDLAGDVERELGHIGTKAFPFASRKLFEEVGVGKDLASGKDSEPDGVSDSAAQVNQGCHSPDSIGRSWGMMTGNDGEECLRQLPVGDQVSSGFAMVETEQLALSFKNAEGRAGVGFE